MLESFSNKSGEVGHNLSDGGRTHFDPDRRLDAQERPAPFKEQRIDPDRRLDAQERPKEVSAAERRVDPDKRLDVQEPGLKELSESQEKSLRDSGMSDSLIEKCKVDKNNIFHLKTINSELAGKSHPETDVKYERKQIEINGNKIWGVFPKFESKFTCQLDKDHLQETDKVQFKDCMDKLRTAVDKDPKLASQFTERQLEQIHDPAATRISGYTWHHNEELGKMELVKQDIHGQSGHTGGDAIWGGQR